VFSITRRDDIDRAVLLISGEEISGLLAIAIMELEDRDVPEIREFASSIRIFQISSTHYMLFINYSRIVFAVLTYSRIQTH
jgi:hypothetical protein